MIFKEIYLHKPITIIMLFTLLLIFGLISFFKLPISLMPEQKTPWVSVIIEYPGISPQKMENLITKPIEEKISTIPGIQKIESVSEEGKTRINIQFDMNKNVDFAILELRENVDIVKTSFPREVQEPLIIKYDPSQSPIVILSLWSKKMNTQELRELAEHKIKKVFQRIDGVSEIFISGGFQREIHIDVDMYRMMARNMDIQDVFREVQFANLYLSTGQIYKNRALIPILAPWKYTSLDQIEDTVISSPQAGQIIKVHDLASVKDTHKEIDSLSRVNLQQRVSLYIEKSGIANTVTVVKDILSELKNLKKEYPDIKFNLVYDQAQFIKNALDQVKTSVLLGSLIASAVLFLFLRSLKATLIIALSIPISVITTFIFFYFNKISLNVFSLSGLALAGGILVDDSIIVLANIMAHKDLAKAVRTIEKAILASTLTTVSVFLPIVFTNKETQLLYGDITLAISFSILVSMFTSLVLLPVLTKILKEYTPSLQVPSMIKEAGKRIKLFLADLIRFLKKRKLYTFNKTTYLKWLRKALSNPEKILISSGLFVLLGFFLAPSLPQEYINPLDSGNIRVFIELPSSINLEETDATVKRVEEKLYYNLRRYIKRISTRIEKAHSTIVIELNKKRGITTKEFIRKAKACTASIKNADVIYSEPSESSDMIQNEITITLIGDDSEKLRQLASELARDLNTIKYITEIIFHFKEPQEQISIDIDKEKAALNGLNSQRIANYLREIIYGPVTTKFFDKDREIDVRVKFDRKNMIDLDDLKNIHIKNIQGAMIPLTAVADLLKARAPGKIYRLNKHKAESFSIKYDNIDLNRIVSLVDKRLKQYPFPKNYYYEFGENYKKLVQNRQEMIFAVVFALLLIYILLASIFENVYYPVIIILIIPVAIASVLVTLFLTGSSLNISVYIGLIMLAGLVVKNSILLIDTTDRLLKQGEEVHKALIMAGTSRLKPIIMTTLTTILGLLPVLIFKGEGSNLWQPLAITVISGLTASTVLTLFITPTAYLFSKKIGWIK